MSDHAIKVEELGKRYHIGAAKTRQRESVTNVLKNLVFNPARRIRSLLRGQPIELGDETMWALKDISFEVSPGEVVGIIGRNGAGKSTLLKILSRITPPTEGRIRLRGRVASLLEVGTGFHPLLTGRENVYMNGTILGMNRREIDAKFDEIVEFAGVARHIDTPVKHYSSGMRVRLGFAVAAHLEPEILLVDEVLAVGDLAFQKKCLGKMEDVAGSGRTVLFVSHNMESIMGLCPRTILIDDGQIVMDGETERVIRCYTDIIVADEGIVSLADRTDRKGSGELRITELQMRNADQELVATFAPGDTVELMMSYKSDKQELRNVAFYFLILDQFGRLLARPWTHLTGQNFDVIPSQGTVVCQIQRIPFAPGQYTVEVAASVNGVKADLVRPAGTFNIVGNRFYDTPTRLDRVGTVLLDQVWWKE